MRNSVWMIVMAVIMFALFNLRTGMVTAGESGGLQTPAEEIIIGDKKPAKFDHKKHLELTITCGQCHHDSEHQPLTAETIAAMENGRKLACQSCHNADFANPKLNSKKLVFHANCKGCHKSGINDKKGPTKCTGCHIKKK